MRRSPLVPAAVLLLLAASACGGSSGSPQGLVTPSATPSVTATSGPTPTTSATPGFDAGRLSSWHSCQQGFQCATLTVALDPKKPQLGTVGIAVTKHPATGSHRIGSLLMNPGGPGASAVDFLQGDYSDLPATIRDHFDVVAFDPRGVGHTAPVHCLSTSQLDSYFHLDPVPDTPAELAAIDAGNRELVQGCQARSGKVLPYVSTAVVVDDMERVRIAVGDPKLTYLGYSYGTAIGAAYLDKYASHVRAMVLDGALDPTLTWDQLEAGQAAGFEGALHSFLDDCQRTSCAFRQVVTGDIYAAFDKLAARVDQHPLPGKGKRVVGPGEFSYGVGEALYDRASGWPALAQGLASAQNGDGGTILALNDAYLERSDNGYSNITEANTAVNCIDRPWPHTDAPYKALAARMAARYPRFGADIALSGLGCAVWPIPAVSTPHKVVAAASPTILVIGTLRDPATPYAWAQGLAAQLAHGVLLTHDGDGHTAYHSGAPRCLTRPVNDYLVSLTPPVAATC